MRKNDKKRKTQDKARGSVSVMLAFLMLPVYTFAGAVADGARVYSAEQTASGAADLAANAALASYDEVLKSVYGLFAMSQTDDELTNNLYEYFNETASCLPLGGSEQTSSVLGAAAAYIGSGKTDYHDLLELQTDYFSAVPVGEAVLAEPAVMKNQVVEYMKYRGPVSLGKGFLAKAGVLSEFRKHNKAVESKVKYEEDLSNIQDLCEKAYSSICSFNSYLESSGINNTAALSAETDTICARYRSAAQYTAQYSASSLAADDLQPDSISEKIIKDSADANNREIIDEISIRLREYMPYITGQNGSLSEGSSGFLNMIREAENASSDRVRYCYLVHCGIWSDYGKVCSLMSIYEKYFGKLSNDEKNARNAEKLYFRKYCDHVSDQIKTARSLSADWRGKAESEKSAAESIVSRRVSDLSVLDRHLSDAVNILENIIIKMDQADSDAGEWKSAISEISDGDVKTNMQSDYENTARSLDTAEIRILQDIIRTEAETAGKISAYFSGFSLGDCSEDYMITDSISASEAADDYFRNCFHRPDGDIPSGLFQIGSEYRFYEYLSKTCGKMIKPQNDSASVIADLNSAGSSNGIAAPAAQAVPGIEEHIAADSLAEILSFSSGQSSDKFSVNDSKSSDTGNMLKSQKKNLSDSSSVLGAVADIASAAVSEGRDDLYLTEYITEMFSCRTSGKTSGGSTGGDDQTYTLSGIKISEENNVFYKNEVEYILWGDPEMEKNLQYTAAMLFGTRFLLNNIYAFTDREIDSAASAAAAAIAGWSGFGVPVVKTVIIMSLALAESVIDVNELIEGKSVVIYKSSSTWNMKPSGIKNALRNNCGQIADMAADKAGKMVGDVFEKIEGISSDRTDELADTLHGMISDIADEAAAAAENAVMGPIDDAAEHILTGTDEVFTKEKIAELIEKKLSLVSSADDDLTSAVSGYMKDLVIAEKDEIAEIIFRGYTEAAGKGQDAVEGIRERVSEQIEKIIGPVRQKADDYIDDLSDDIKKKVSEGIESAGDRAKEYASDTASRLVNGASDALVSGKSGGTQVTAVAGKDKTSAGKTLTLNYREYLKLFVMLSTFSESKEEQMLSRMAVLMQINLSGGMKDTGDKVKSSINSNFDITHAYTMIRVDAEVKMKVWFMSVFVPDSVSGPDGETVYSYDYSLFGTGEKNISVHSIMSY